jgi:hypothetical protein
VGPLPPDVLAELKRLIPTASVAASSALSVAAQIDKINARDAMVEAFPALIAAAEEAERLRQYVPKIAKSTATFDELWLECADAEARRDALAKAARPALDALTALNAAVWLKDSRWALASSETGAATEAIVALHAALALESNVG